MPIRKRTGVKGFTLVEILVVCIIIVILAAIIILVARWGLIKSNAVGCKANLKDMSTALNLYSNEFGGFYPPNLTLITPSYVSSIPRCPSTSQDTYSAGYSVSDDGHSYTLCCNGQNHGDFGYGLNQPYYSSSDGLMPSD